MENWKTCRQVIVKATNDRKQRYHRRNGKYLHLRNVEIPAKNPGFSIMTIDEYGKSISK